MANRGMPYHVHDSRGAECARLKSARDAALIVGNSGDMATVRDGRGAILWLQGHEQPEANAEQAIEARRVNKR